MPPALLPKSGWHYKLETDVILMGTSRMHSVLKTVFWDRFSCLNFVMPKGIPFII